MLFRSKDEIDISRGDVICTAGDPVEASDQFQVEILWMSDEPMLPGRPYLFKSSTKTVPGTLEELKYKVNVNTMEHVAAKTLALNEIGVCNLELDSQIAFAPYIENRHLGSFIIIDRFSNNTVGMGLMSSAVELALIFIALEISSISTYILAGFRRRADRRTPPPSSPAGSASAATCTRR